MLARTPLFRLDLFVEGTRRDFDVAPDGRFLMMTGRGRETIEAGRASQPTVVVLINAIEGIRAREAAR